MNDLNQIYVSFPIEQKRQHANNRFRSGEGSIPAAAPGPGRRGQIVSRIVSTVRQPLSRHLPWSGGSDSGIPVGTPAATAIIEQTRKGLL